MTLAEIRKFEVGTERPNCSNRKWQFFLLLLSLKLFHTCIDIYLVSGIGHLRIHQLWHQDSRQCGQKGGVHITTPLVSRQHVCKHFTNAESSQTHAKFAQMFLFPLAWASHTFVLNQNANIGCKSGCGLLLGTGLELPVEEADCGVI